MLAITLIIGIIIGAIVMAVINRRRLGDGPRPVLGGTRRRLFGRRPEDTALSRDLNEHAGGSRHIRTHPSWRDQLE